MNYDLANIPSLNLFKYSMISAGAWPAELIPSNYTRKLYILVSIINQWIFMMFMLCMYIELPITMKNSALLMENISISILYTLSLIKVFILKSKALLEMLYVILRSEKDMPEINDTQIYKIFSKYIYRRNLFTKIFLFLCTGVCISFIITHYIALIHYWDGKNEENGVRIQRPLPYVSYFPLDRNKYYNVGFVFHSIMAFHASFYYVVAQLFILTFLVHVCCRLECLQHILRNLDEYSAKYRHLYRSEEEAVQGTLYLCLVEHQHISKFLKRLNDALKMLMLLEFGTASIQIASLLFTIVTSDAGVLIVFGATYFSMMIYQVVVIYWQANEIKVQSVAIADAIYETSWFAYNKKISTRLLIMIMRSQKPMKMHLGPFGEMSLETSIAILKGVYSFFAFMYR